MESLTYINPASQVWWFSCSVLSESATPWTVDHQASLSLARIQEWGCNLLLQVWSQLRDWTWVSCAAGGLLHLQADSLPTDRAFQYSRCKRHGFDTWVGKVHWSRKWQSTPVFLAGKHQGHDWARTHSPISTVFSKNRRGVCRNKISSP